jgi:hypothetical protein
MAAAVQSTPQKVRSTADTSHTHATTLDEPRDALVRTATANQVPLAIILETLFPFVTSTHVDEVMKELQSQGNLKGEGWTAFEPLCSQKNKAGVVLYEPRHSSKNEDTTFKPLEQVFEQIAQAHASVHNKVAHNDSPEGVGGNDSTGQTPLVKLSIHGISGDWSNSTRPDGSIHLKETSLPWPRIEKHDSEGAHYGIDYADICLLIETKLHLSQDNLNDVRPTPNNAIEKTDVRLFALKGPEQVTLERAS